MTLFSIRDAKWSSKLTLPRCSFPEQYLSRWQGLSQLVKLDFLPRKNWLIIDRGQNLQNSPVMHLQVIFQSVVVESMK